MNTSKSISVLVLSAFFLIVGTVPAQAQVFPEFLGDFCWSFTTSEDSGFMRLGVTDMSGPDGLHFQLTGVITTTSNSSYTQSTINGNAEDLFDGIHVTLTQSRFENGGITQSVMHAVLDSNLNGPFREEVIFDDSVQSPVTWFRSGWLVADCL